MAVIRALVSFDHDSGLAQDRVTNTFHFNGTADSVTGALIVDDLISFYGGANVTASLLTRYGGQLAGTATIKLYDLADSIPRVPFYQETINPLWTPSASVQAPAEVSVCASFQATPGSGLDQKNRRGRIYLGPLIWTTSVYDVSTGTPRVASTFRTDIITAMTRLAQLGDDVNHASWVVYSKVLGTTALVTQGWVDNAFDTVRSRGEQATARTTATLYP